MSKSIQELQVELERMKNIQKKLSEEKPPFNKDKALSEIFNCGKQITTLQEQAKSINKDITDYGENPDFNDEKTTAIKERDKITAEIKVQEQKRDDLKKKLADYEASTKEKQDEIDREISRKQSEDAHQAKPVNPKQPPHRIEAEPPTEIKIPFPTPETNLFNSLPDNTAIKRLCDDYSARVKSQTKDSLILTVGKPGDLTIKKDGVTIEPSTPDNCAKTAQIYVNTWKGSTTSLETSGAEAELLAKKVAEEINKRISERSLESKVYTINGKPFDHYLEPPRMQARL